ncbi:hypothetical protein BGZ94_001244, partial [Podila epigama]
MGITIDMDEKESCCNFYDTTISSWSTTNHPKWMFALAGYGEINGEPTWCGAGFIAEPPEELFPEDGPQWDVPEPTALNDPEGPAAIALMFEKCFRESELAACRNLERLVIKSVHTWNPRYTHHDILFDAIGQHLRYFELTSYCTVVFDLVLALEHLPCLEHIRLGTSALLYMTIRNKMFLLLNKMEHRIWYHGDMDDVNNFDAAVVAAESKKTTSSTKPAAPFPRLKKMDLLSAEMPFLSFCKLMARLPNLIHLSLYGIQYPLDEKLGWKKIFPDEQQRQRFQHFGYACENTETSEAHVKSIVESFPNLVSLHLPKTRINIPTFQTISQHYATNLRSLDLRLRYFDETVTYQLHLLLCAGKFKNLVHLIAPDAVFLISDLQGFNNTSGSAASVSRKDVKLWQTPQLRVLMTSFDVLARRRASNERSAFWYETFEDPTSAPALPCSCLGIWEQTTFRHRNYSKDPVPQHTCCEASSVLAEFLSTQCPLLEVLRINITPQACLGYAGLRALGRLRELRELELWVYYLDRTKRQDLGWIQDMTTTTTSSSSNSSSGSGSTLSGQCSKNRSLSKGRRLGFFSLESLRIRTKNSI